MKNLNDYIEADSQEFRQEELILETTELIARVMSQTGISKAELAGKLKKTKSHVTQCLSGEQNLTLRTLADFFGALGYRMQVGAEPLDVEVGKPIPRLYPIGGWSFEQICLAKDAEVIDCAAVEDAPLEDFFEFQEAAA